MMMLGNVRVIWGISVPSPCNMRVHKAVSAYRYTPDAYPLAQMREDILFLLGDSPENEEPAEEPVEQQAKAPAQAPVKEPVAPVAPVKKPVAPVTKNNVIRKQATKHKKRRPKKLHPPVFQTRR